MEARQIKRFLWSTSYPWLRLEVKPEFAMNKAVVRVALGNRHHSGVNYIFHVTLIYFIVCQYCDRGCIQVVFKLSFCWKTVFVTHSCCSAHSSSICHCYCSYQCHIFQGHSSRFLMSGIEIAKDDNFVICWNVSKKAA